MTSVIRGSFDLKIAQETGDRPPCDPFEDPDPGRLCAGQGAAPE